MIAPRSVAVVALTLSTVATVFSAAALLLSLGVLSLGKSVSGDFDAQARAYLLGNPDVLVESIQRFEEIIRGLVDLPTLRQAIADARLADG